MKLLSTLSVIPLLLLGFFAAAQGQEKSLALRRSSHPIIIDGIIDPAWSSADSAHSFFQMQPYFARPPLHRTVARILTDEKNLYCLILCYDEREHIQANTGKHDDFSGDIVSLMLDTFNDRRTAYKFAVNAGGSRADCRLLDDARHRDYSWDGVWFSASRIYDWGWAVEMEIPYRSIQYGEGLDEWGLDFDRWSSREQEDLYWNSYEQAEGQRISRFARLLFTDYHPTVRGLNLEIYPVGLTKAEQKQGDGWSFSPNAGVDLFYNPSQRLTLQLTGNPDFAQIEADPFEFNISRYETYYSERRPFFTEGNEVFMPSGKERGSGFISPMELFYSRRIGRKLPDGSEVPLLIGSKAFGRLNSWEYGGFVTATGKKEFMEGGATGSEPSALYSSVRLKKQVMGNSSVGLLYVGKNSGDEKNGVIDVDGAFRAPDWQLSYQIARSYRNDQGDYAASVGLWMPKPAWVLGLRSRYVGEKFDIQEVGYVPWHGTWNGALMTGPVWRPQTGAVSQIMVYGGGLFNHEKVDDYTDRMAAFGYNMQFRKNWGFEINLNAGRSSDMGVLYNSREASLSSWFNTSPAWEGNLYGGYSRTFNFARGYLASYGWAGGEINWRAARILSLGSSADIFFEGNPAGAVEEITFNARPYLSWTPVNNLNMRLYVDNLYLRTTGHLERVIGGFLFSYNFRPKSWLYFALNEVQERSAKYDGNSFLPNRLHTVNRVNVVKLKYLFYF
ncbi:MAG TPA: DUF5916 domain-containing protein [bacterium]|mgnify:FL=1|nr:DUF5916 domain-containing protein [bacterium]